MTQQLQAAQWHRQKSSAFGDEAFWPGEHKTFAQLESDRRLETLPETALASRNKYWSYTCTPDAHRINIGNLKYIIPIYTLRHVTSAAQAIINDGGFRGDLKKVATVLPDQPFSWWSAHYNEGESWRDEAEHIAEMASQGGHFSPSYPFVDEVYRGDFAFFYPCNYLLNEYKNQFCYGEEPFLRIMGTFVYNQQIQHVIVVHSRENGYLFSHLPEVSNSGNRVFFQESDGLLYWCPESIVRRTDEPWSPWERLSVAFHLPEKDSLLRTEDIQAHCFKVGSERP